jgi:hypothetical protein
MFEVSSPVLAFLVTSLAGLAFIAGYATCHSFIVKDLEERIKALKEQHRIRIARVESEAFNRGYIAAKRGHRNE